MHLHDGHEGVQAIKMRALWGDGDTNNWQGGEGSDHAWEMGSPSRSSNDHLRTITSPVSSHPQDFLIMFATLICCVILIWHDSSTPLCHCGLAERFILVQGECGIAVNVQGLGFPSEDSMIAYSLTLQTAGQVSIQSTHKHNLVGRLQLTLINIDRGEAVVIVRQRG